MSTQYEYLLPIKPILNPWLSVNIQMQPGISICEGVSILIMEIIDMSEGKYFDYGDIFANG